MALTFDNPNSQGIAQRIHELSHDLKMIEQLRAPTLEQFLTAPILHDWRIGTRSEIALVGKVEGHPTQSGLIVTSGLYFLDPDVGYARTLSRWYRLAKPHAPMSGILDI